MGRIPVVALLILELGGEEYCGSGFENWGCSPGLFITGDDERKDCFV